MNPSNRYARDITLRLLLDRSILEVCKYVIVDRMRKSIFQREHFYSQVSVDEYNTIKICDKNSHCLYYATEFIHDDLFF